MKYFKPELLARCRSLDDVAEAAVDEWERARLACNAHLKSIRSSLPQGVRRLVSTVPLDDAKVLSVSFGKGKPRFSLRVRLEGFKGQPGEVLELRYRLVAGPNGGIAVRKGPPIGNNSQETLWVLANEFDMDEERGFFTHSLLLTNGTEVVIHFHSISTEYLEEVILPFELTEEKWTWPLVEA